MKVDQALRDGNIKLAHDFTRVFCSEITPIMSRRASFMSLMHHGMKLKYGIDLGPGRSPFHIGDVTFTDDQVSNLIDKVNAAAEL
jgi:hypothetical protein